MRAGARMGELLEDMAKRGERETDKGGDRKSRFRKGIVKLADLGVTPKESGGDQRSNSARELDLIPLKNQVPDPAENDAPGDDPRPDPGGGHTVAPPAGEGETERLLTIEEACEKLAMPPAWVLRNAKSLGFLVRLEGRHVRFSSKAIDKYIREEARRTCDPWSGKGGHLRVGHRVPRVRR